MSDEDRPPDREKEFQEETMIVMLVFILALIVLDVVAIRWGVDSTDGPESREWERRQQQALD